MQGRKRQTRHVRLTHRSPRDWCRSLPPIKQTTTSFVVKGGKKSQLGQAGQQLPSKAGLAAFSRLALRGEREFSYTIRGSIRWRDMLS